MNTSNIDDLFPCISCGVNADPADGFGKCTCGNEAKREAIQQELLKAREEGYKKGYIDGGIGVINERFKDI